MAYLERNPSETYGVYWNAMGSTGIVQQGMLFYTADGHLILGLAVNEKVAGKLFTELVAFAGTAVGMFGCEQRPPETASEFILMARSAAYG